MQFADAASGEPHVHTREGFCNRQLAHGDLARPSAFMQAFVRDGEGILEGLHAARIGRWRVNRIQVFLI